MKPFIPRSKRTQDSARKTFDNSNANLQNLNEVNKKFWEKKNEDSDKFWTERNKLGH